MLSRCLQPSLYRGLVCHRSAAMMAVKRVGTWSFLPRPLYDDILHFLIANEGFREDRDRLAICYFTSLMRATILSRVTSDYHPFQRSVLIDSVLFMCLDLRVKLEYGVKEE